MHESLYKPSLDTTSGPEQSVNGRERDGREKKREGGREDGGRWMKGGEREERVREREGGGGEWRIEGGWMDGWMDGKRRTNSIRSNGPSSHNYDLLSRQKRYSVN